MRAIFLIFGMVFLWYDTLFLQEVDDKSIEQREALIVQDSARYAVIAFDQKSDWPFPRQSKPVRLSEFELKLLESMIDSCVQHYNSKLAPDIKSSYSIDFKRIPYKLQYVPVLNKKGQIEVWVNAFCNSWDKQWKTEIIFVFDGGNCYFNLKINLATKECFDFSANGDA